MKPTDEKPVTPVTIRWHEDRDPKRLQRVVEILAKVLDNGDTSPPTTPTEKSGK